MTRRGVGWLAAGTVVAVMGASACQANSTAASSTGGSAVPGPTRSVHPTSTPATSVTTRPATTQPRPTPTATTTTATRAPLDEVFDRVRPNVIRVAVTTCDEGAGTGSGFLLGNGLVTTAAHVVWDAATVTVAQEGGVIRRAEVVAFAPQHDAALLRPAAPLGGPGLSLREAEVRRGEPVAVIGYPLGSETIRLTQGLVSGLPVAIDYPGQHVERAFITDAATNGGNSGGPVVDTTGQVLGIVSGSATWNSRDPDTRVPVQGTNYVIPAADLAGLVRATPTSSADLALATCDGADPAPGDGGYDPENLLEVTVTSKSVWADTAAQTLFLHGTAINDGSYESAWNLFTPRAKKALGSLEAWSRGVESSFWTGLDIVLVDTVPDVLTVDARLTTRQDADQSAQGNSCSVWAMVYTLHLIDGTWFIDEVKGTESACP